MTKRQRAISKALAERLPTITYKGFMRWYAGCMCAIRKGRGNKHRIISATAVATSYIYHQLGVIHLPRIQTSYDINHSLADLLTRHDMDSLMAYLGVLKRCSPEQRRIGAGTWLT